MDDLDHRNLGVKLNLWHLQEDAPGMVFWHPRGYAVYRVLEDYVRRKMRRAGYAEVRTPQLLPQQFWSRSGHWDKFGEHVPGRRRRTGDGVETDVVSVPRADLQQGAAFVAGASDPLCRVRRLPPP